MAPASSAATSESDLVFDELRRFAGMPAYLAGRYLRDSGTRTSISVGALITAVALFTALVVMIHSFRQTVELWVQQTVSGDLFVTTKMGQVNRFRFPIPEPIVSGLQRDFPRLNGENRRVTGIRLVVEQHRIELRDAILGDRQETGLGTYEDMTVAVLRQQGRVAAFPGAGVVEIGPQIAK